CRTEVVDKLSKNSDQIDWRRLGNPRISNWLEQIASTDDKTRRTAMQELKDAVAPWELLDGFGSTKDLMRIAESQIPEAVIPFLLETLKRDETQDKGFILEILFDLSRYLHVHKDFIPLNESERYQIWAKRLHELIRNEMGTYWELSKSTSPDIQFIAQD